MEKLLKQRVEILAQEVEKMKSGGAGEGYTKAEADAKFLSKDDAATALAGKQDSLNQTQLAAVNSGINSAKVAQIENNKTNILLVQGATEGLVDEGAKNIVKLYDVSEFTNIPSSLTITKNSDGSLTLNGSVSSAVYSRIGKVSGNATGYSMYASTIVSDNTTIGFFYTSDNHLDSTGGLRKWHNYTSEWSTDLFLHVAANSTLNNVTLYPMICLKSKYDISDNYQPPALPNYDLTRLEAEDRAALVEVVDEGAKNKFRLDLNVLKTLNTTGTWTENVYEESGVTFTVNTDDTITTTGTASAQISFKLARYNSSDRAELDKLDGLMLSGCPSGGDWNTYALKILMPYSPWATAAQDIGEGNIIDTDAIPSNANVDFVVSIYSSYPQSAMTFKPMICTKAEYDVSPKFVPYRPSYQELYEMVLALQTTRTATTRKTTKTKTNEE